MFYKAIAPGCLGHGEVGLEEAAPVIAKYGYEGYQFDLPRDMDIGVEKTLELLQQYSLKPACFGLPVEFRKDDKTFEEDLAKFPEILNYAEKIGLRRCATWLMPRHNTLPYRENLLQHATRLRKVAEMLKDHGMILGLEFVGPDTLWKGAPFEFIHTLDGLLDLISDIGTGNVGILLDSFHWDMAGQTFDDFTKLQFQDAIVLVHINDAAPCTPMSAQLDQVRRLPGATGVLNMNSFFAGLDKVGYDGPVVVEPFEPFLGKISFDRAAAITMQSINRVWPAY